MTTYYSENNKQMDVHKAEQQSDVGKERFTITITEVFFHRNPLPYWRRS